MQPQQPRRIGIHREQRLHLSVLHVHRKTAEGRPSESQQSVPVFFVRREPAVNQQNPAGKEQRLDLGQNEGAVSAEESSHCID